MNAAGSSWTGGLVLPALGLTALLSHRGLHLPHLLHGWALLLLIPALGALAQAVSRAHAAGRWTAAAGRAAYGGLFPLLLAGVFLFGLHWAQVWPLFGLLVVLGALLSRPSETPVKVGAPLEARSPAEPRSRPLSGQEPR